MYYDVLPRTYVMWPAVGGMTWQGALSMLACHSWPRCHDDASRHPDRTVKSMPTEQACAFLFLFWGRVPWYGQAAVARHGTTPADVSKGYYDVLQRRCRKHARCWTMLRLCVCMPSHGGIRRMSLTPRIFPSPHMPGAWMLRGLVVVRRTCSSGTAYCHAGLGSVFYCRQGAILRKMACRNKIRHNTSPPIA